MARVFLITLGLLGSLCVAGAIPAPAERVQVALPPPATKVTLFTLGTSLRVMAGRYVWILKAQAEEVVTPRAFVLVSEGEDGFDLSDGRSRRALVVTAVPVRSIREEQPVDVIGTVYTLQGALTHQAWPQSLSAERTERFRDWPVILAERIQTPGGVLLYPDR